MLLCKFQIMIVETMRKKNIWRK